MSRLQRPRWKITADVQNVGDVDGCEVPQLYLEFPASAGEPPRVLRDFSRSVGINLSTSEADDLGSICNRGRPVKSDGPCLNTTCPSGMWNHNSGSCLKGSLEWSLQRAV